MAKDSGGHKSPHPPELRAEAERIARSQGPDAASRATGVAAGAIRSWMRRRRLKDLQKREDPDSALNRLRREGRAMMAGYSSTAEWEAAGCPEPAPKEPEPADQRHSVSHLMVFGILLILGVLGFTAWIVCGVISAARNGWPRPPGMTDYRNDPEVRGGRTNFRSREWYEERRRKRNY